MELKHQVISASIRVPLSFAFAVFLLFVFTYPHYSSTFGWQRRSARIATDQWPRRRGTSHIFRVPLQPWNLDMVTTTNSMKFNSPTKGVQHTWHWNRIRTFFGEYPSWCIRSWMLIVYYGPTAISRELSFNGPAQWGAVDGIHGRGTNWIGRNTCGGGENSCYTLFVDRFTDLKK